MAAADAEVANSDRKFIKNYTFPVENIPRLSISNEEAIRRIDDNVILHLQTISHVVLLVKFNGHRFS